MRRDFSKGFVRLQDRNRTESEADDAQVRRFKQILLDEVDLQELSRLPADERRARLERVLAHLISREGVILSTRERSTLVRRGGGGGGGGGGFARPLGRAPPSPRIYKRDETG